MLLEIGGVLAALATGAGDRLTDGVGRQGDELNGVIEILLREPHGAVVSG